MSVNMLDAAMGYWENGWTVIPINPETKRPLVKWGDYQDAAPPETKIYEWWEQWPNADIALVTGAQSGHVVVDCDNKAALAAALDADMHSPIRVKTKRGVHLYFTHPRDGVRRGPRAGSNSRGEDWPKIDGLDFRGDGSYAVLPPSVGYEWQIPDGLDLDDAPEWEDWRPSLPPAESGEFSFADMDLSSVRAFTDEDFMSEWDRTAKFVREKFPGSHKIPSGMGNARNERVMRFISECVMDGYWSDELRVRGYAFMREFYEEALPDPEFEATCRSIEEAERRNHPERFDTDGRYIPRPGVAPVSSTAVTPEAAATKTPKLIQMADADTLLEKADAKTHLISPWLPVATIVQVYGYSGHGKSLFVQHALAALASGRKRFGPFEIGKPAKVLYMDWENGMATIGRRLKELESAHGDTSNRLRIWAPFLEETAIDLKTQEGMLRLQNWVMSERPDVVVIDTIRSAFPGLEENSAQEWARINAMAVQLRNGGISTILIHHANKPRENGAGGEAGSTAQLTVLETQIRVGQVFEDKETATMNAGIYDGDYDKPIWPQLKAKTPEGFHLYMVNEIRYGKVREWSEDHDRAQWLGYAAHDTTDERIVVASSSTKQKAKQMAIDGFSVETIARSLHKPLATVKEWLEV